MVNEINKIIRNTLLTGGEGVFLPGIGSLTVETRAAVRSSRKELDPPRKIVVFSEKRLGVPMTDIIASLGIDPEQAHEVYNDWRVRMFNDGVLNIEGVGELRDEKFSTDRDFLHKLNPQGITPVKIKPRQDAILYIFAVLCCLFAFCVAGYIWYGNQKKTPQTVIAINEKPQPKTVETEPETESDVTDIAKEDEAVAVAEKPAAAEDKNTVLRSVSGHSYLVLGIFSTEQNAFRAVANAERSYPAADCRVYRYADKFMVSLFESTDSKECLKYKRETDSYFPDTWIYNKK